MLLEQFLNAKEQKKRILIVSDLNRGRALVRKHEAVTGKMVCNLTCMTLSQMAEAIYMYLLSEADDPSREEILPQRDARMLFRGVLFEQMKSLKYFNEEKMMDLATTKEIFSKADLIRGNGWSEEENNREEENRRIADLNCLISEYERRLEEKPCMDHVSLLRYIVAEMKKRPDPKQELQNIFAAEIFCLSEDTEFCSGIEKEFLSMLQNREDRSVKVYGEKLSVDSLNECKEKSDFFRGYGSFNEAGYVANDILKREIPFGQVTVLYVSQAQLPAITFALKGNGLNARVVSDHPAWDNAYISLAGRILAWAKDDFSEKALEQVLASAVISAQADLGDGEKKNMLAGQAYFDYISSAAKRRNDSFVLGWGYNRNRDFIKHEELPETGDGVRALLTMHGELLDIFEPYENEKKERVYYPITVYEKLVAFLERHTVPGEDFAAGMERIRGLSKTIRLEERMLTLKETLSFIEELLADVSVKDAAEADAITVQNIRDWVLLDRPCVYVIGLSLKDMQGGETESPILSDKEIQMLAGNGYKPTVKARVEKKERNLYRTLKSFSGERIVFGFSSYDTVKFCENNPSSFFREALAKFKGVDIKELPEFVYGNPTDGVEYPPAEASEKSGYEITCATNSMMEELLKCPKKYYYDKYMHIPENEYTEKDYSRWLDARLKGLFFHEIAERYVNEKLIKPAAEDYDANADEALIETFAEKIKEKMLVERPVAFEELAKQETEDLVEAAAKYLGGLHTEFCETGWRALFAEQRFANADYTVEAYDGRRHSFTFTGIIDRIDYRIDKQQKTINLRIIDYKTGKKDRKNTEKEHGMLFQYVIYEKALMENGYYADGQGESRKLLDVVKERIAGLEALTDIGEWEVCFDSFQYVFPMESTNDNFIEVREDKLEDIGLTRLKCILTAVQDKKTYPDCVELFEAVEEYRVKYASADPRLFVLSKRMNGKGKDSDRGHCEYCNYKELCMYGKAGESK